jgi:hypothetical protein
MNTASERSEIEYLLPWHAAGTLSRRDRQRVDAALAGDPELARRYDVVRDELAQTIHLNETLGAPSARAIQTLFAKIDAEPARRQVSANLGTRVAEFFANLSPRTLAWSATAAALAILLQVGLIAGIALKEKSPGGYETASAPTTSVASEGSYVLIRFQPQADVADITRFLEANKFSIADGPAAGGLYRVRVATTKLPQTDLAHIVNALQDNKLVGFIVMTE